VPRTTCEGATLSQRSPTNCTANMAGGGSVTPADISGRLRPWQGAARDHDRQEVLTTLPLRYDRHCENEPRSLPEHVVMVTLPFFLVWQE
jgi:hypothetical protein